MESLYVQDIEYDHTLLQTLISNDNSKFHGKILQQAIKHNELPAVQIILTKYNCTGKCQEDCFLMEHLINDFGIFGFIFNDFSHYEEIVPFLLDFWSRHYTKLESINEELRLHIRREFEFEKEEEEILFFELIKEGKHYLKPFEMLTSV